MPKDRVAILLKKTALVIEKLSNPVLSPYELTSTQYKVLMMLYQDRNQPVRQTDIEERYALTNPTVTGILQNLEKKNMVKRVPNPQDKRSKLVTLTEQAIAMEDELVQLGETLEKQVTAALTDEEYAQMIMLLKKVLKAANAL